MIFHMLIEQLCICCDPILARTGIKVLYLFKPEPDAQMSHSNEKGKKFKRRVA